MTICVHGPQRPPSEMGALAAEAHGFAALAAAPIRVKLTLHSHLSKCSTLSTGQFKSIIQLKSDTKSYWKFSVYVILQDSGPSHPQLHLTSQDIKQHKKHSVLFVP